MAEVLAKTTFSSVIHNNEVCDEIVKWGNANGQMRMQGFRLSI